MPKKQKPEICKPDPAVVVEIENELKKSLFHPSLRWPTLACITRGQYEIQISQNDYTDDQYDNPRKWHDNEFSLGLWRSEGGRGPAFGDTTKTGRPLWSSWNDFLRDIFDGKFVTQLSRNRIDGLLAAIARCSKVSTSTLLHDCYADAVNRFGRSPYNTTPHDIAAVCVVDFIHSDEGGIDHHDGDNSVTEVHELAVEALEAAGHVIVPLHHSTGQEHHISFSSIRDPHYGRICDGVAHMSPKQRNAFALDTAKRKSDLAPRRVLERARKFVEDDIDLYCRYLNGEIYRFSIEDTALDDIVDGCGGYYTINEAIEAAAHELALILQHDKEKTETQT